jgi:hypothetical protein
MHFSRLTSLWIASATLGSAMMATARSVAIPKREGAKRGAEVARPSARKEGGIHGVRFTGGFGIFLSTTAFIAGKVPTFDEFCMKRG